MQALQANLAPQEKDRPPLVLSVSRVWTSAGSLTNSALFDLAEGLRRWPLWGLLGWQDIALRYRRSLLGPLWLTLSMGVMVGSLGVLYGVLFKLEITTYLPFLCLGFLVWGMLSSLVVEGCQCFIEAEALLRQVALPTSLFAYRVMWRNLLVFAHNAVIYVLVALIFDVRPGWAALWAIPGLFMLLVNGIWVALLLGMLSARFRDIPQVISSLMQVIFFITPIVWTPELLPGRQFIVNANPIYHFVELVRAPLLGHTPTMLNWGVTLGITAAGWLVAFLFHRRFHVRIAYWV